MVIENVTIFGNNVTKYGNNRSLKPAQLLGFLEAPYVYVKKPPFSHSAAPLRDGEKGASRKQSRATVPCLAHAIFLAGGLAALWGVGLAYGESCSAAGAVPVLAFPPRLGTRRWIP